MAMVTTNLSVHGHFSRQFSFVHAYRLDVDGRISFRENSSARHRKMNLDELRSTLHASRDLEESLQQMLTQVSVTTRILNAKFTDAINKSKFMTIPDDILGIILEMACHDYSSEIINGYMRVCRRFRHLLITQPALWSSIYIGSEGALEEAKFLERRATAPIIHMLFSPPSKVEVASAIYELTASISPRIRHLTLYLTQLDVDHLQQASTTLSSLSLPFLSELELSAPLQLGRQTVTFIREWDMPQLSKLRVNGVLPNLRSDVATQIKSCAVEINRERIAELDEGRWRANEIVAFVNSLPYAKELRVAVRLFDEYTGLEGLTMASVESLILHLDDLDDATSRNILDFLRFPAMTSLELRLGLPRIEDLKDVLDAIRHSLRDEERASITDLTLYVGHERNRTYDESREPFTAIENWCKDFGELKSLKLENDRFEADGLLAFTRTIDSLEFINSDGGGIPLNLVGNVQRSWDYSLRRCAVIDMKKPLYLPLSGGFHKFVQFK